MSSAIAPSSTTFRRRKPRRRRTLSTSSSSVSDYEQDDWAAHNKQHLTPALQSHSQKTSPATSHAGDGPSLLTLPMEIILHHLVPQLNYPALLALRLAHPRFYHSPLLYPPRAAAIRLRVAWLLELGSRGLWPFAPPRPSGTGSGSVDIATDQTFLANGHVQAMLREERASSNPHAASSWLPRGFGAVWDRTAHPSLRSRARGAMLSVGVMAILLAIAAAVTGAIVAVLRLSLPRVMNLLLLDGT